MKPKYKEKLKLCYMDTDSFICHIKTKDFFKDIASKILLMMLIKDLIHQIMQQH